MRILRELAILGKVFYKVRSASGNTTDKYINVQSAEKETTESGSDKEVESEKGKVGKEARFEYNVPIKVETNGEFPKRLMSLFKILNKTRITKKLIALSHW